MIRNYPDYYIQSREVKIYNAEKHRLPCWKCLVQSTCFCEIESTARFEDIIYTVKFKEPCVESVFAMDLIDCVKSDLTTYLKQINKMNISELFDRAENYIFKEDTWFPLTDYTGYVMFICVILRDANYIRNGVTAYHHLGDIFENSFGYIDLAIDLYSKGIDLTPEDFKILESRGFCFLKMHDLKSALTDFKKAKKLGGLDGTFFSNLIDDINKRLSGLRGNSVYDHLYYS